MAPGHAGPSHAAWHRDMQTYTVHVVGQCLTGDCLGNRSLTLTHHVYCSGLSNGHSSNNGHICTSERLQTTCATRIIAHYTPSIMRALKRAVLLRPPHSPARQMRMGSFEALLRKLREQPTVGTYHVQPCCATHSRINFKICTHKKLTSSRHKHLHNAIRAWQPKNPTGCVHSSTHQSACAADRGCPLASTASGAARGPMLQNGAVVSRVTSF